MRATRRRSVYLTVKRSQLVGDMVAFDAPEPLTSQARRPVTTVAPQALFLLNNPMVASQARLAAGRVLANPALADDAARRDHLWRIVLGRPPSAAETSQAIARWPAKLETEAAWATLAHALFASPDFRTLD